MFKDKLPLPEEVALGSSRNHTDLTTYDSCFHMPVGVTISPRLNRNPKGESVLDEVCGELRRAIPDAAFASLYIAAMQLGLQYDNKTGTLQRH